MDILTENNAFQNVGMCITKKCNDDFINQTDDFLQFCIQMLFYEKISVSGLVPDYVSGNSREIIDILSNDYDLRNISFENNIGNLDKFIIDVIEYFCKYFDSTFIEYKSLQSANGLLPKLNDSLNALVKRATDAIKTGSSHIIHSEGLYNRSTFSIDSAITKIVFYNGDEIIFKKMVEFSKNNNNIWNEIMTFQLISDIRVITNKLLAGNNNKIYSPTAKRGRKIKQILENIDNIMDEPNVNIWYPNYIELSSIREYLIKEGNGSPLDILKITSELREKFLPVRSYLQDVKEMKRSGSQYELNEICIKLCDELKTERTKVIIHSQDEITPSIDVRTEVITTDYDKVDIYYKGLFKYCTNNNY